MKPPHHMLPGQPPAWQTSLGQGPLGHVSQAWLDALLRPTANPESSFCISELSHFSQLCLREAPAFSRNLVTCSHLLHLYSNIGTTLISHYRSVHFDSHRRLLHLLHIIELQPTNCKMQAQKVPQAYKWGLFCNVRGKTGPLGKPEPEGVRICLTFPGRFCTIIVPLSQN